MFNGLKALSDPASGIHSQRIPNQEMNTPSTQNDTPIQTNSNSPFEYNSESVFSRHHHSDKSIPLITTKQ